MLESAIKRIAYNGAEHLRPARRAVQELAGSAERRLTAGVEHEVAAKAAKPVATTLDRNLTSVISKAEKAVLKNPTLRNEVVLHVDAAASHQALLDSIRTAKSSFYIETFIWHNDETGNQVIQALADRVAKAKAEGKTFDAKVLIDWFGLRQGTGGTSDKEIVAKLRNAGVDTIEFARSYVDSGKLVPITHRKLYIKDGESFITGGRNIGDEYLRSTFTNPKGTVEPAWHDLMYTVKGDETGRIIDEFFRNWKRAGGEVPPVKPAIIPSATGRARVESFLTDPHVGIRTLREAHLNLIANAEKEIVVMYPYLSDDKLVAGLLAAKKKNPALSIKVILPANREASAEGGIYSLLNKESARQLMEEGIEVRMFAGGTVDGKSVERFSHFKGMMVDNKVVSIGSANGDARTFTSNHELNTIIADASLVAQFKKEVVGPDWRAAEPLTTKDLASDGLWVRVKQTVLEWFDFLL